MSTLILTPSPAGPFNIDGDGFGDHGELRVDGQIVETTRWQANSIKGAKLPSTFAPGSDVFIKGHAVVDGAHVVLETRFTYVTSVPEVAKT